MSDTEKSLDFDEVDSQFSKKKPKVAHNAVDELDDLITKVDSVRKEITLAMGEVHWSDDDEDSCRLADRLRDQLLVVSDATTDALEAIRVRLRDLESKQDE